MKIEEKLFGLIATAEEQQKVVEIAGKALANERLQLEIDRKAIKSAIATLEATIRTLPSTLQQATASELFDASEQASKAAEKAFTNAGEALKADLDGIRTSAKSAANTLDKAFKRYTWKWAALIWAGFFAVLGIGWGWVFMLQAEVEEQRASLEILQEKGGKAKLSLCGKEGRLCVQIDKKSGTYGNGENYMIIKGY
jgi:hypothetical protein